MSYYHSPQNNAGKDIFEVGQLDGLEFDDLGGLIGWELVGVTIRLRTEI